MRTSANRSISLLLVFLIGIIPARLCGQDTTKVVPDGTEGEVLATPDSIAKAKKGSKPWNQLDLGFTTFKFGLGYLYEFAAYSQDDNSKIQTDSIGTDLEPTFKMRDFRILFSGKLRTKRTITWKVGVMYDGPTGEWFVRESGVIVAVPELWGSFFCWPNQRRHLTQ